MAGPDESTNGGAGRPASTHELVQALLVKVDGLVDEVRAWREHFRGEATRDRATVDEHVRRIDGEVAELKRRVDVLDPPTEQQIGGA